MMVVMFMLQSVYYSSDGDGDHDVAAVDDVTD